MLSMYQNSNIDQSKEIPKLHKTNNSKNVHLGKLVLLLYYVYVYMYLYVCVPFSFIFIHADFSAHYMFLHIIVFSVSAKNMFLKVDQYTRSPNYENESSETKPSKNHFILAQQENGTNFKLLCSNKLQAKLDKLFYGKTIVMYCNMDIYAVNILFVEIDLFILIIN